MPDENQTHEIIHDDYNDGQYEDFLYEMLGELPLLSLWDVCIVVARMMFYSGSVPDCIKGMDLNLLHGTSNSDFYDNQAILKPIQSWLSEQIIKSIDNQEVCSKLLGRFADGKIDAKRTYVDFNQIDKWLMCRDITLDDDASNDFFIYDRLYALKPVYNAALSASQILKTKACNPNFKIPINDSIENDQLLFENDRLRRQIEQIPSRQLNHKKTHGNAERFAEKREQVLGVALSVITQWPDQCRNSSGKFEARKIAKLIDQKSPIYWPLTGEPPLSLDKMEREISKWINGEREAKFNL